MESFCRIRVIGILSLALVCKGILSYTEKGLVVCDSLQAWAGTPPLK